MADNIAMVKCKHGSNRGQAKYCPTCIGSGYVKVILGHDGKPKECEHAGSESGLENCSSCQGSGWAGLVIE